MTSCQHATLDFASHAPRLALIGAAFAGLSTDISICRQDSSLRKKYIDAIADGNRFMSFVSTRVESAQIAPTYTTMR
jgi:hypothetical protein